MMFSWSVSFISKIISNEPLLYAALSVSSLNALIQIALDFLCGSKRFSKLGGWYND